MRSNGIEFETLNLESQYLIYGPPNDTAREMARITIGPLNLVGNEDVSIKGSQCYLTYRNVTMLVVTREVQTSSVSRI